MLLRQRLWTLRILYGHYDGHFMRTASTVLDITDIFSYKILTRACVRTIYAVCGFFYNIIFYINVQNVQNVQNIAISTFFRRTFCFFNVRNIQKIGISTLSAYSFGVK